LEGVASNLRGSEAGAGVGVTSGAAARPGAGAGAGGVTTQNTRQM